MAIFSAVPPPPALANSHDTAQQQQQQQQQQPSNQPSNQPSLPTNANGLDIESWALSALESLSVSPLARGTGAPLSIPLDETKENAKKKEKPSVSIYDPRAQSTAITPPPRPPSRRDSLKRREALLKGNEGSRQRRRWENDRLLHVPNAVPPEPQDYLPRPTHPVNHVPYQIAAAWELRVRAEVESRNAAHARRKQAHTRTLGVEGVAGRVPRELCQRAKKTPAVRTWVRSLEEPVRKYLVEREMAKEPVPDLKTDDSDSSFSDMDSEDEEIVFVGRNGSMRDGKMKDRGAHGRKAGPEASTAGGQWKRARREEKRSGATQDEGMLFDAFGDEDGGAFRRWITHSISDYYGLQSRSVLVGEPKRKVVYVGIKQMKTGHTPPVRADLPRPLWELC
ncbi:R3H-associated N-terminal domain-containing protein [Xylaria bambusicola]|uniref:R3H-associated N-terminal domain-containing protein n=1 Tax=Xylaria bambusicola TaxID=326684 RepID=UPI0020088657|nr:R3H-associated N-terminal domain-containing protein [Xylaria bambusicola]KAI0514847.1 R3H-associated N-terminal domain-containing protein [Xylaria bambusicola]